MKLFDEGERVALEHQGFIERGYSFLNRSAWPSLAHVRQVLEAWFRDFPESAQADLAGRFITGSDEQNRSAFFELWAHELLRRSGCTIVEAHPEVAGTRSRPDFLVETPGGQPLYVEAFCSHDRSPVPDSPRLKAVFEALDQFDSPDFFINITDHCGAPATAPSTQKLRAVLRRWLAGLDYAQVQAAVEARAWLSLPRCRWSWDGWHVEFTATPKTTDRGVEGIGALGALGAYDECTDSAEVLQGAVEAKAHRYRSLEHPLLLMIDMIDMFLRADHVKTALFGRGGDYAADSERGRSRASRPKSIWLGPDGPRNRHVSAVLAGKEVSPWYPSGEFALLVHNPWAKREMPEGLLPLDVLRESDGILTIAKGLPAEKVLGLPQGWLHFGLNRYIGLNL